MIGARMCATSTVIGIGPVTTKAQRKVGQAILVCPTSGPIVFVVLRSQCVLNVFDNLEAATSYVARTLNRPGPLIQATSRESFL